jgi:hypothetical protein
MRCWWSFSSCEVGGEGDEGDEPWIVGFCKTHHKAWRCKLGMAKEYTEVLTPSGGLPHDAARARWPDGFETELSDLTVQEFLEVSATISTGRNKVKREWEGQLATGQKLWISEKKDHKLLLVLYQESRALIYLPANEYKELAMKVLIEVATEYIKDPSTKDDLKATKATKWKEALSNQGPFKRPAAAATPAASPSSDGDGDGDEANPAEKRQKTSDTNDKSAILTDELATLPAPTTPPIKTKVNFFGAPSASSSSASSSSSSSAGAAPLPRVADAPTGSFMDDVYF